MARRVLSLASVLLAACVTGPPPAPHRPELADDLLADSGTTAIDLITDMAWYFADTDARSSAELVFGDTHATVELDHIGASSTTLYRWRKLRLRFGDAPKKRLYLTPHCNDAETAASGALQSEEQLYAQALAYRVLAALDVPALDNRLVHIRWIDRAHPERAQVRPAILVEDVADVARLMVGDEDAFQGPGKDGPLTDLSAFDPAEVARFHLFELLINNRDWRAFRLRPLGRIIIAHQASVLHNVFALDPRHGRPVLIPLDLDASSFAALPGAVADATGGSDDTLLNLLAQPDFLPDEPPLVRWMALRIQGFRRAHAPDVAAAAIANFVARRAALNATVGDFEPLLPPAMRPAMRARAAAHFDAFFRAVSPPLWDMPVVAVDDAVLYSAPTGDEVHCHKLMRGAPLLLGARQGGRVQVRFGVKLLLGDGPAQPLCPGPDGAPLAGWLDARAISAQGRAP